MTLCRTPRCRRTCWLREILHYRNNSYEPWAAKCRGLAPCAGAEVQAYLQDAQNFYIAHVYQETSSELILYNWDNMYWAGNVFMAQLTDEGACKPTVMLYRLCVYGSRHWASSFWRHAAIGSCHEHGSASCFPLKAALEEVRGARDRSTGY